MTWPNISENSLFEKAIESIRYLKIQLYKEKQFPQAKGIREGGWFPLCVSSMLMLTMLIVHREYLF